MTYMSEEQDKMRRRTAAFISPAKEHPEHALAVQIYTVVPGNTMPAARPPLTKLALIRSGGH
mgnify:CR=1 FL=1|jgi:hypothetical protein